MIHVRVDQGKNIKSVVENEERMRLNDADFLFFYFDLVNITYNAWEYFRIENHYNRQEGEN